MTIGNKAPIISKSVSRRDFFRVAGSYGLTSTALAASILGAGYSLPQLELLPNSR